MRINRFPELFAQEILRAFCKPENLDFSKRHLFGNGIDDGPPVSEPFVTGALLSRLNRSYAPSNHYLSTILAAEEYMMMEYPNQTEEQRYEYRYALCAAENWRSCLRHEGFLPNTEPIFPEGQPPVKDWSPLVNALCAAAWMGHEALVRQLLQKGADPNVEDGYYRPPLQQAARKGHYDIVLLLLEAGANINLGYSRPRDFGKKGTLVFASRYGHEEVVNLLLKPIYRLNVMTSILESAVYPAIQGGSQHLVQTLIENPEIKQDVSIAKNGERMLLEACISDQDEVIRWLLLEKHGLRERGLQDPKLLQRAALHGRTSIVRLLLDHGANRFDCTLANAARNGHVGVAKLLLDTPGERIDRLAMVNGQRPFVKKLTSHLIHQLPLYWASKNGHISMVKLLLQYGARLDNEHMRHATIHANDQVVRLLVEALVEQDNVVKDCQKTLRDWAERMDKQNVVRILSEFGYPHPESA